MKILNFCIYILKDLLNLYKKLKKCKENMIDFVE